jgi:phosphoribosyl-AMP cyclohydrolase
MKMWKTPSLQLRALWRNQVDFFSRLRKRPFLPFFLWGTVNGQRAYGMSLSGQIKFNDAGLVPAIAQDVKSGRVLMMAWMNEEAVNQTLHTGFAHYYSRSRQKQWKKGESSGHVQKVVEMFLDCDGDTLLLKIEQVGPACHTNRESCFYKQQQDGEWVTIEEPMK